MDMKSGFRVATIRRIPIRIHPTFLLILPLLAYGFGRDLTAAAQRAGIPALRLGFSPWLYGMGLALALFASVLVHELAHSLYAVRKGGRVLGIVLLPIGGVSEMAEPPKKPGQEAMMALAGPATSLLLGAVFFGLQQATRPLRNFDLSFALFYLSYLNVALGIFNLLPAFPMDGGRILRGLVARKKGTVRATEIAAALGKVFAAIFAALGFVSGDFILLVIAFFVFAGAEAEEQMVLITAALGDLRVREVMTAWPESVSAAETLAEVGERMLQEKQLAFPVANDGRIVGVLTAETIERVPAAKRRLARAAEAIVEALPVDADDRAVDALRTLEEKHLSHLAVTHEGRLLGLLGRTELAEGLRLRQLERSLH
jgi:Zn-dependent protease